MTRYPHRFRITHPPVARKRYYRFKRFPIGIQVGSICLGLLILGIVQQVTH